MAKAEDLARQAEELLLPIVEEHNFEIWDVEYVREAGNWYLRAYIDKEEGITTDDCELVSRAWEEKLDAADFLKDAYILEVSSPGLNRQLKKDRDFAHAMGKEVEVKLFKAAEGEKEFSGILKAYDGETVTVDDRQLARKDIALIRLAFDW